MPLRDRGPARRYVRNLVDSRRSIGEYFLPIIFVVLLLSVFPVPAGPAGAGRPLLSRGLREPRRLSRHLARVPHGQQSQRRLAGDLHAVSASGGRSLCRPHAWGASVPQGAG
jgi:hypothetical protein